MHLHFDCCICSLASLRDFLLPLSQNEQKSDNEFMDLWVSMYYIRTENAFPTTHRRQRVVEEIVRTLNPLEMAVTAMEDKNKDLASKIAAMADVPDGQADQNMSMAINGTVDAAVNGGTKVRGRALSARACLARRLAFVRAPRPNCAPSTNAFASPTLLPRRPPQNYETFVTGEYRETNPEIWEDICANPDKAGLAERLVDLMREQVEILAPGVDIHGHKCSEQMLPLHEHIKSASRQCGRDPMRMPTVALTPALPHCHSCFAFCSTSSVFWQDGNRDGRAANARKFLLISLRVTSQSWLGAICLFQVSASCA